MSTATITAKADFSKLGVTDVTSLKAVVTPLSNGRLQYGDTEEGIRTDNNMRASWGALALITFVDRTLGGGDGEDWGTCIGDLLADLMHLCDALDVDFDEMVDRGRMHYEPETHGEL